MPTTWLPGDTTATSDVFTEDNSSHSTELVIALTIVFVVILLAIGAIVAIFCLKKLGPLQVN